MIADPRLMCRLFFFSAATKNDDVQPKARLPRTS